jgi:MFS family permease
MNPSLPRHPHPVIYLVLILPFGATSGFLTVALAYTLSRSGVSVTQIGALIALYLTPQTWKFLWAPIVDTTLTRKRWYLLGVILNALGVIAMGVYSSDVKSVLLFDAIVLMTSTAVSFLGMASESLLAYGTNDAQKGRAGGWLQAGNLGGQGLGGGAALWLAQHVQQAWVPGVALGAIYLLCSLALCLLAEPVLMHRTLGIRRKLSLVGADLWQVARSRSGYLALLIFFLPIGTGAASNLWSAIAQDWHASAGTVELINGVLGGLMAGLGCLVGGYLCDRFDRKRSYIAYGLMQALCAIGMALAPRTPLDFGLFTAAYAFANGLTYSGFSAVTLEAMGLGAAATKYNVFASLSNMPIAYMTLLDGWAHTRWGADGMLYLEAALGAASLLLFGSAVSLSTRRPLPAVA